MTPGRRGGAGAFAARDAAGAHGAEVYNRFNQAALAPMCPATAYWQEKLASIVGELAGRYDVDGVYVDQIGMASPRPCYDPSHGHPLGGGTWWLEGNRFAVAGMRAQLSRPGEQALLTESCAEVYLGLFDGFVVLDNSMEKFGAYRHTGERCRPVPLLPAIYHGYAVTFGSYASLADPPYDDLWPAAYRPAAPLQLQNTRWLMQLRVELARTLGDGNQPMLANFQPHHLTERAPAMDFVLRLARLYDAARPYLLAGARLPEPEVDAPPVKVEFWGKSVYTLPGHDQVFTRTLPAVLATAWMAADGSVAVTAINITADAVRCTLRLPDEGTRAIAATGEAPLRWEDGETSPLTWSGGPTLELALAGTAAVLVRWERAAGRVSTRS